LVYPTKSSRLRGDLLSEAVTLFLFGETRMIKISGIFWSQKKIGIALKSMTLGVNLFEVTVLDRKLERLYPRTFVINRERATEKYGISVINKRGLEGVWIPLTDLEQLRRAQ